MNEQQLEWCRKLHFRKGCFSLLLSLRLSPVAVGFFFIRSSQRKSCQNFSSPLLFPTMLFLRPVITMIAVSFFNPQRLSCERVGLWCRFSIESSCTHYFFPHLILVFFPCENSSEWILPKNVKSRGNPSLWQLDWYNMSSNRMKRWYDQRWGLFSRLIVKCFDIWLI